MMEMRKRKTLVPGLMILLFLFCLAPAVSAAAVDITTGQAVRDASPGIANAALPDAKPGSTNVLWDLTHGVYLQYQPSQDYSSLVTLLGANGFSVETTTAGVDQVDLSKYNVLVISLTGAWNSGYTPSEVSAIQKFVNKGGGLLIMGENTDCPNPNIQPVANLFNVQLGKSYLSPSDLTITDLASSPVFSGVGSFFMRAAGEIDAKSPAGSIAWTTPGKNQVVAAVACPTKVVIAGDNNMWDNAYLPNADNGKFAVNTFTTLAAACGTPVPEFPTPLVTLGILGGIFLMVIAARRR